MHGYTHESTNLKKELWNLKITLYCTVIGNTF